MNYVVAVVHLFILLLLSSLRCVVRSSSLIVNLCIAAATCFDGSGVVCLREYNYSIFSVFCECAWMQRNSIAIVTETDDMSLE